MTNSASLSTRPLLASVLTVLALTACAARADDAPPPVPHWSGLPIWGVDAAAKGYQVPLPFGAGITAYSARQPVNIQDLRLGRGGNPPVSVTNFLQVDQVDTSQENLSAKLDVLIFPFLDVYALVGQTRGSTKGLIQVPADPILGIFEPRQLQLDAQFSGPTYGAGLTLQGGTKINAWRDLTAIGVADWNRTRTNLEFDNESLIAETKPTATVFSARVGLHFTVGSTQGAAIWTGAMHQEIQQEVAGSVADTDLEFLVVQSPANPWNMLLGGMFEFGRHGSILLEGGLGTRTSILAAGIYRF